MGDELGALDGDELGASEGDKLGDGLGALDGNELGASEGDKLGMRWRRDHLRHRANKDKCANKDKDKMQQARLAPITRSDPASLSIVAKRFVRDKKRSIARIKSNLIDL